MWAFRWRRLLKSDSLYVVERRAMVATVIQFGGPTVRMSGNPLSHFKVAAVLQIGRDSRRSEAMARESASKLRASDSTLNHLIGIGPVDGLV